MRESIWRLPWITCLVERANGYPCSKNVKQRWSYRRKIDPFFEICRKKSSEIGYFLLIVSWRSFPPEISRENGRFFLEFAPENPSKFDFFPLKSRGIGRFFCEFWLRLFTVPYFFMRYTASYRHRYLDFVRYTASYRHRYLDFQMYRGGGRRGL